MLLIPALPALEVARLVRPAGSLSRLDASNVLEKQRACSALDAVSLGTGCILQGFKTKKHEVITSGSEINILVRFLHNPVILQGNTL